MEHEHEQRTIAAVLEGDANAFTFLVKRYERPIYNLMLRMTGSQQDALDLSQEAFVKAYEKLDKFKTGSRFFPWLYAIGMNTARDFLRRNRPETSFDDDLDSKVDPTMENCADPAESAVVILETERVHKAMLSLSPEMREAIILRFREELSFQELAQALNVSLSGAKMRVTRGLAKLRIILAEECKEPGAS